MNNLVILYALYISLSLGITIWVGRTLHKNGRRFLVDVFKGDNELADSVNHLLVVGFYLVNLGFVSLAMRSNAVDSITSMLEVLSGKIGGVLLLLGAMHFFNLFVFSRMRKRAGAEVSPKARPPVNGQLTPAQVPVGVAAQLARDEVANAGVLAR